MPFLTHIKDRRLQPELIDQPDLEPERLVGALRGLERINWWSRSASIIWRPLSELARQYGPLRVLDIATGAGDVPIQLWRRAQRAGLDLHISGCDRSPDAIAYARRRAVQHHASVAFFECDAVHDQWPEEPDVIICSLFLHHLDEPTAGQFLERMRRVVRRGVLINDLLRSRAGFALAWIGTRILSASAVVHTDGPRSVEGAFTLAEVRELAMRAGMEGATVARRWPCRYLLTWLRTPSSSAS